MKKLNAFEQEHKGAAGDEGKQMGVGFWRRPKCQAIFGVYLIANRLLRKGLIKTGGWRGWGWGVLTVPKVLFLKIDIDHSILIITL